MTELLIDSIRAAVAESATADARVAGVAACRSILAALEPTAASNPPAEPAAQIPVAAIATALRGSSPDQLLDLAIAKLRSLIPKDAQRTPVAAMRIPLVPVRKP